MSEGNGYVTRDSLFGAAPKRRYIDVECELGKFRLRSLNAFEKASYDAEAITKDGKFNRRSAITGNARLVALCCVDADGNRLFTGDDVAKLQELDAGALGELADACREHCGFTEAEDAEKN